MKIRIRNSFKDIPLNMLYVEYDPYGELPTCEDYQYGKKLSLVFRNKFTGELERIGFTLCGAVPFLYRSGYQSFWGQIDSKDRNVCLVFTFDLDGRVEKVTASFSSKAATSEEIEKSTKKYRSPHRQRPSGLLAFQTTDRS